MSAVEVTVESLGGLGDGIATLHGKPVFIAKSCPGDRLSIRIVRENQNGITGAIESVLAPGPQRQQAPCPYFDACGGCVMQQFAPPYYREFKTRMLRTALAQAGFDYAAEVVFLAPESRRRVEFKISPKDCALAFHALNSHTPVEIKQCMILTPPLQAMIEPINALLPSLPFAGQLFAISLTAADYGMDMTLVFRDSVPATVPLDAFKTLGLARINARTRESAVRILLENSRVEMQLGKYRVALPPEAFLQASAEAQRLLTGWCADATASAASIADLFCGIGSYSIPLSMHARVHAVEGDESMVRSLRHTLREHNIAALSAEQRDLFKNPLTASELGRFDAVILNPPRVGARAQAMELAKARTPVIVMISCNPATFARDARILKEAGYKLVRAQGVDQFVWSPHLEIAAVFSCGK